MCVLSLKDFRSTEKMVARGVQLARQLAKHAQAASRVEVEAKQLRIGLNCAGTDRFSSRTSHAVCGAAMDRLIAHGGTAIMSEIPEMIDIPTQFGQA